MIFVIATVELVEGRRPEYLLELRKMIPVVRAEKGCLEYGGAIDVASGLPVQEPVDENAVVIIERWGRCRCAQSASGRGAHEDLPGGDQGLCKAGEDTRSGAGVRNGFGRSSC